MKFCLDSPGDILVLCEHGAHRSAGLALLLLLRLGYDDAPDNAACLEMARWVIDCSAHTRLHRPQKLRVANVQGYVAHWVGERFPELRGQRRQLGNIVEKDAWEAICRDILPNALAANAAESKSSPRATTPRVPSREPPTKRTNSATSTPRDTEAKKPRPCALATRSF